MEILCPLLSFPIGLPTTPQHTALVWEEISTLLKIDEFALVDNVSLPIRHSLQASSSRTILVLWFPPFKSSLFYDPSIGLAELLGEQGTPSSSDEALIIGVTVGSSTLLLVLVVLVLLITLLSMIKWKTQ